MNGNGTDAYRGDAGREMDARVHEVAFGQPVEWRTARPPRGLLSRPDITEPQFRDAFRWAPVPRYSTEIAAAWVVVARMREAGFFVSVGEFEDGRWGAYYCADAKPDDGLWDARAKTAPEAICRAALAALAECLTPQPETKG